MHYRVPTGEVTRHAAQHRPKQPPENIILLNQKCDQIIDKSLLISNFRWYLPFSKSRAYKEVSFNHDTTKTDRLAKLVATEGSTIVKMYSKSETEMLTMNQSEVLSILKCLR